MAAAKLLLTLNLLMLSRDVTTHTGQIPGDSWCNSTPNQVGRTKAVGKLETIKWQGGLSCKEDKYVSELRLESSSVSSWQLKGLQFRVSGMCYCSWWTLAGACRRCQQKEVSCCKVSLIGLHLE